MEVEADVEVLEWAAAERVSDLLPKLIAEGFLSMSAVRQIKMEYLAPLGITKVGDQIRVLEAVRQANVAATVPDVRMVAEEMQEMRELFVNFTIHNTRGRSEGSMPSSFAKRYARLPKVKTNTPWFSVATERPVVPGRSRRARTKFLFPEGDHPAAGADEVRVVQPYWSKKLKDFPDDLAVVLEASHRSAAFGDRKPDVVGYLANKPRSVFHIALVGEVKARRQANKESFDASEMGHLESFLEELLLEFQPYRQSVNGFLTDGCLIQFFRLANVEAQLLWMEGPVLYLHDGGDQWLLGLLQDTSAHGVPAVAIGREPVAVGELLGVGGSSVVYSGMFQGAQVVVKRFTSLLQQNHLEQEAANLDKIQHMVPRVPRLIARDSQHLVLLLQPVGVQFASRVAHFDQEPMERAVATADDFCQLVDILETVHSQHNLVHRDVRLPNFFRDQETGVVFLNDWGCATEVGKSVLFSGALQHAPRRVLESARRESTYTPQFSDDLEMVVRSVFQSISMTTFEQIRTREDPAQICRFWEHHLAPPTWAKMLAAAQRGDYAELKTRIRKLLP